MTEAEYLNRAEHLLQVVEQCCDALNEGGDIDLDNQRVGNMVTITLPNRSQLVINLQKPLREVWLAAREGGFHFQWQDDQWRDTKSGAEFFATLTRCATAQAGQSLVFALSS